MLWHSSWHQMGAGCTDSAEVRNSWPPLVMRTPKLQKHVGNFSCLSGKQRSLLSTSLSPQNFMQIDLEVMLCSWKCSVSESDLETLHYSSCHLRGKRICISHFKFNLPRLWNRWRFIQIWYMFSLQLSMLLGSWIIALSSQKEAVKGNKERMSEQNRTRARAGEESWFTV